MAHGKRPRRILRTLDAKVVLGHIIRSENPDEPIRMKDGAFINPEVLIRSESFSWCMLFDQLRMCLQELGVGGTNAQDQFEQWFMYMDFNSIKNELSTGDAFLNTSYGAAMEYLIEHGFSIVDTNDPECIWHYTVFDMSASNARNATVTFLADQGFDANHRSVDSLYGNLKRRLDLNMDVKALQTAYPHDITWNKYYSYRALSMSTAERMPPDARYPLDQESVLVIDTVKQSYISDVLRAHARTVEKDTGTETTIGFDRECDQEIQLKLFDGEGIVTPDYAAYFRQSIYHADAESTEPASFQIRMPFAKGVLHEVDFHRFMRDEVLRDSSLSYQDVNVVDAFGVSRSLANVKIILTTDMLKCHQWLKDWVALLSEPQKPCTEDGEPDPMAYYFDKFHAYEHGIYVAYQRPKQPTSLTATNGQFLSTLCMNPDEFDAFVSQRMAAMGDVLFDTQKAASVVLGTDHHLLGEEGTEDSGDELPLFEDDGAAELNAIRYAVNYSTSFLHDRFIHGELLDIVKNKLVDYATGTLPVKGTWRLLSQDLLEFLCLVTKRTNLPTDDEGAAHRIEAIEHDCLTTNELYLPGYDGPSNDTGLLAIFRNPHLSRSEQAVLCPHAASQESLHHRYFGHLNNVAMISCASLVPMILSGADYDGDHVHIFDDAAIVNAVLIGAYIDPQKEDAAFIKEIHDGVYSSGAFDDLHRRYPIPDQSADPTAGSSEASERSEEDDLISDHLTFDQLRSSFQSNVGILSNSALRLSTILYGLVEGRRINPKYCEIPLDDQLYPIPTQDLCAEYTLAVGIDVDSVKTGFWPDMTGLYINGYEQDLREGYGIEGKLVPEKWGYIHFKSTESVRLKYYERWKPLWQYAAVNPASRESRAGERYLYMSKTKESKKQPLLTVIDPTADFLGNTLLVGSSISTAQRLPWLLLNEVERIHEAGLLSDAFLGGAAAEVENPLSRYAQCVAPFIDDDKLRSIEGYVTAYEAVDDAFSARQKEVREAKRSTVFGKARRCAQEFPTKFFYADIDSILADATLRIRERYVPDGPLPVSCIKERFEKAREEFFAYGFSAWTFCKPSQRKVVLKQFLDVEFSSAFYELLEDDALVNGALIPFYLVQAAQDAETLGSLIDTAPLLEPIDAEDEAQWAKDEQTVEEFTRLVNDGLKRGATRNAITKSLQSAVKERMLNVLKGESSALLDYLCVLQYDPDYNHFIEGPLFWNMITPEDLQRAFDVVSWEEEGSAHA